MLISRKEIEIMIKKIADKTGRGEDDVRREVEALARINGFQIEDSTTMSLVEHFSKMATAT